MACAKMYESCISPQFRAIDPPNPSKRFIHENARLATVASTQNLAMHRYYSGVRKIVRNMSAMPTQACGIQNYIILRQVWTSDDHAMTKGDVRNVFFATVLGARRPRYTKRLLGEVQNPNFGRPTTTTWWRVCSGELQRARFATVLDIQRPLTTRVNDEGCLPCSPAEPTRTQKKKGKILEKRTLFEGQPFSASSPTNLSQQPLSAPFSAAILSSHPHQPFSATFLSSLYQPPCWAAILSSQFKFSQIQYLTSSCCGQGLMVSSQSTIESGLVVNYLATMEHQLLVINFLRSSMTSSC